jgi:hypothetical protein
MEDRRDDGYILLKYRNFRYMIYQEDLGWTRQVRQQIVLQRIGGTAGSDYGQELKEDKHEEEPSFQRYFGAGMRTDIGHGEYRGKS